LTLSEAIAIALDAFPGELVEWELESEVDEEDPNAPTIWVYEFEIEDAAGEEIEVEMDALTGEIL